MMNKINVLPEFSSQARDGLLIGTEKQGLTGGIWSPPGRGGVSILALIFELKYAGQIFNWYKVICCAI